MNIHIYHTPVQQPIMPLHKICHVIVSLAVSFVIVGCRRWIKCSATLTAVFPHQILLTDTQKY